MATLRPIALPAKLLPALTVVGALATGRDAHAQERPRAPVVVAFDYDAPAGCPSSTVFRQRVEARGEGRPVVVEATEGASLRVRVRVTSDTSGRVRSDVGIVTSRGEDSERSFDAATCEEVVDASALLVAIAIEAEPGSAVSPTPPPSADATPAATKRSPIALLGYVNAGIGGGIGPDVGPLLEAGVGIRANRGWNTEVRIEGRRAWLGTVQAEGGTARFDLTAVAVEGCPFALRGYGLRAAPCVALSVGSLAASASGYPAARDRAIFFVGADLGARLTMDVSSLFFVGTEAWATVPLVRETFVFGTTATAHRVASLGISGSASIGLHFE